MIAFTHVCLAPTQLPRCHTMPVCGSIPIALPRARVPSLRPMFWRAGEGLQLAPRPKRGAFRKTALTMVSSTALEVAKFFAGPCINIFNFVMIVRIILTWYPKTDLAKVPWIFIAVPTEPLLRATRKVIQPVGGVDISPIVWFAIMSFVHEILVGPQGLLVLLSQK